MGRNRTVSAIITILILLCAACSSGDAGKKEPKKENKTEAEESKGKDKEENSGMLTFEDLKDMELPNLPDSFEESKMQTDLPV